MAFIYLILGLLLLALYTLRITCNKRSNVNIISSGHCHSWHKNEMKPCSSSSHGRRRRTRRGFGPWKEKGWPKTKDGTSKQKIESCNHGQWEWLSFLFFGKWIGKHVYLGHLNSPAMPKACTMCMPGHDSSPRQCTTAIGQYSQNWQCWRSS